MTDTIETTAVAVREHHAIGQPLSVSEIKQRLDFIRQVMAQAMVEGQDYGKVPGCGDKPGLFQPGAQKLLLTFQLSAEVRDEIITDYQNYHRGYRTIVRVSANGGKFAEGVGECSTLESKYRYRTGGRKCPQCGKETIIKGKAEYGGGWLCFAKRGGCGAKWSDGAAEIESQSTDRVENDNPPDSWNTARKMAFKRALVHASINFTNTSELWSQDLEDLDDNAPAEPMPANFAFHCPIIAILSGNALRTLPQSDLRRATQEEGTVLLGRLLKANQDGSLQGYEPVKSTIFIFKHQRGDFRIEGEYRFIGEGIRSVPCLIAIIDLRSGGTKSGVPAENRGSVGTIRQSGKTVPASQGSQQERHRSGSDVSGDTVSAPLAAGVANPAPKQAIPEADPMASEADRKVLLEAFYKLCPKTMIPEVSKFLEGFKWTDGTDRNWLLPSETIADDLALDKLRCLVNKWDTFRELIDKWIRDRDQIPGAEVEPVTTEEVHLDPTTMGTVEFVSVKEGKKKDGTPWTNYGAKILMESADTPEWYNTFDRKLGEAAQAAQGSRVAFTFERTAKGNTLKTIQAVR